MTSRVYIHGDVACPTALKVFDADTDQEITDIVFMDLTVSSMGNTEATLTRRTTYGKQEVVDVVPDPLTLVPKSAVAPTHQFSLSVTETPEPGQSATLISATLRRPGQADSLVHHRVTDLEVRRVAFDVLEFTRRDALHDVLTPFIDELAKRKPVSTVSATSAPGRMPNAQPNTGGTVSNGFPFIPGDPYAYTNFPRPVTEEKCPECGGTGEVELFNGTVPCSTCTSPDSREHTAKLGMTFNCRSRLAGVRKMAMDIQAGEAEQRILEALDRNSVAVRNPCAEISLFKPVDEDTLGYVPSDEKKADCPDCGGTGVVELFTSTEPCSTCNRNN